MASEKQLEANRTNAQKSTGPRTNAGKAHSRLNSRKHGLTAKTLVIVGENADDFDHLRAELMNEHDPQSALECELVERLAGILWRLRRLPFFEAAILDARQAQVAGDMREEERRTQRWDGYEEEEEENEGKSGKTGRKRKTKRQQTGRRRFDWPRPHQGRMLERCAWQARSARDKFGERADQDAASARGEPEHSAQAGDAGGSRASGCSLAMPSAA